MRRIWAAVIFVSAVLLLSFLETKITVSACNEIDRFVDKVNISESAQETVSDCDELIKAWEKRKNILDIFLNHEQVNKISETVSAIRAFASSNSECDVLSECERLCSMAQSLRDSEKLLIENIL